MSNSLVNLLKLQVTVLLGKSVRVDDPDKLGPFGGVHFRNGKWTTSGTYVVQSQMLAMLDDWPTPPEKLAKDALGRLWGLTGPPLGATAAAEAISKKTGARLTEGLVRSWARSAIEYASTHPAITRMAVGSEAHFPETSRPSAKLQPSGWPPADDWEELVPLTPTAFQALRPGAFRALVREAVEHELRTSYFDWPDARDLAMYCGRFVFPHWNSGLTIQPAAQGVPDGKDTEIHRRVNPVLQMLAFGALDGNRLLDLLGSSEALRRFLARVPLDPSQTLILIGDYPIAVQEATNRALSSENQPRIEQLTTTQEELRQLQALDGRSALMFADTIADANPSDRPLLIRKYVGLRNGSTRQAMRSSAVIDSVLGVEDATTEDVMLALADQSVHLAATRELDQSSIRSLNELVRRGVKYQLLGPRNVALSIRDPARMPERLGHLVRLERVSDASTIIDDLERAETQQQVALAIADTCTKIMSMALTHGIRQGSNSFYLAVAIRSVEWSALALSLLSRVADLRQGLPAARRASGSISRRTWLATALEVRLRTLLTVYTAAASGFIGRDESTVLVSLGDLNAAFIALIEAPGLETKQVESIGIHGTWLGFLNGGNVPISTNSSHKLFTGQLEFLYQSGQEGKDDGEMMNCDFGLSASWHREIERKRIVLLGMSDERVLTHLHQACDSFKEWKRSLES